MLINFLVIVVLVRHLLLIAVVMDLRKLIKVDCLENNLEII